MSPGVRSIVISKTLRQTDYPDVEIVNEAEPFVRALKTNPGKDVWLFGGGTLFRSLLSAGLVDGVDVAIVPVLLGEGIPLLPLPGPRTTLVLRGQRVYEKSGIVGLEYDVLQPR